MVLPALAAWIGVGVTYRKSCSETDIVEVNLGLKNQDPPATVVLYYYDISQYYLISFLRIINLSIYTFFINS